MTGFDPSDEPPLPESVWNLLRRDEPSPRAIQAAYRSYAARRAAPLSAFSLVRWLAAGFAVGWGVAFAATGDPLFGAGLRRAVHEAAPVHDASPPVQRSTPRTAAATPSALLLLPDGSEAPALQPSSRSANPPAPPRAALTEPPATDPQWQRAAAALKARDYDAAESALREVETGGAPGDRDAASLALAQVLLTRGRVVEARARLERLSTRARSAPVRDKATALLAELSSGAGRSAATPAVPQ